MVFPLLYICVIKHFASTFSILSWKWYFPLHLLKIHQYYIDKNSKCLCFFMQSSQIQLFNSNTFYFIIRIIFSLTLTSKHLTTSVSEMFPLSPYCDLNNTSHVLKLCSKALLLSMVSKPLHNKNEWTIRERTILTREKTSHDKENNHIKPWYSLQFLIKYIIH